ncbi:hypothetical protein [Streptomyces sp. OE57]|uniref:hypothetical protein n=1 Tax=Streptomyces lacaronensis TaxID=3379885 RepID=UPI0039B76BB6
MPIPEPQRDRLDERDLHPGVRDFYQHLGEVIAAEAKRFGGRVVVVDGSCGPEHVVKEVEGHFVDVLARGPLATSPAGRRQLLRYANRAFVVPYQTCFTRLWARALGDGSDVVLPFTCECARAVKSRSTLPWPTLHP